MNLVELIRDTFSGDNTIRSNSQKKIEELIITNPVQLSYAAAAAFTDESNLEQIRQTAGILINRSIAMAKDGPEKFWMGIDAQVRNEIKTCLLGTLATKSDNIKRVAAAVIAEICKIEIPLKEWQDIIPILAKNTSHQDVEIKKAAILTLGYICENLKSNPGALEADKIDNILTSICLGLAPEETNLAIKQLAVKALNDSLVFMEAYFEKKEIRDFVMNLLLQNCLHDTKEIKIKGLQCLIDVTKLHYDKMLDYVPPILKVTQAAMQSSDREVVMPAVEVWNTVATEDKERGQGRSETGKSMVFNKASLNLTSLVYGEIIPYLHKFLLSDPTAADEDEGSLLSYTSRCLSSICEAVGDNYLASATDFAGIYLQSANPVEKRAGLVCFASMLEGPSKEKLVPLVSHVLGTITNMLGEPNIIVQEAAASTLAKTAEVLAECFLQTQNIVQILPSLTNALNSKPKVSFHLVKVWLYIGEFLKNMKHSLQFNEVIEGLMKNGFRTDIDETDLMLIEYSFIAIMSLLIANKNTAVNEKYLKIFVQQFKTTVTIKGDRKTFIQNGLLACIQTCLLKYLPMKLDDQFASEIYLVIGELFKLNGDITADGIHVIGGLAAALEKRFVTYAQDFWQVLSLGLKRKNESDVFSASLGSLIEVAKACPEVISEVLTQIYPFLMECLLENSFDKNLKVLLISAIGDISLACKEKTPLYFDDILKIYNLALEAAIQPPTTLNPEMTDYLEQLRDVVLESYVCFVHATEESPRQNDLIKHLPTIIDFLKKTCNQTFNPTVDFLRNALALITDIGHFFGASVRNLVKTDFTIELINILNNFSKFEENQKIIQYAQNVLSSL
jgi:importin subunit beta-1